MKEKNREEREKVVEDNRERKGVTWNHLKVPYGPIILYQKPC
jgi:hypothetical protein